MTQAMLDLFPPTFARTSTDLTHFMAVMQPAIDRTIAAFASKKFDEDPICGTAASRIASIVGSATKRHGRILEIALREGLRESGRHRIWTEPRFAVSRAADNLFSTQSEEDCQRSELPYGDAHRVIQIDVGVDAADSGIGAYELKRANGLHDAGKIRSMRRDLACTRLLLKSYGLQSRQFSAHRAEARIIFYYGKRSIPAPYSLIGAELDDHFGFAITARIEAANQYYRESLQQLLQDMK